MRACHHLGLTLISDAAGYSCRLVLYIEEVMSIWPRVGRLALGAEARAVKRPAEKKPKKTLFGCQGHAPECIMY